MNFASLAFFLFLVLVWGLYWGLPRRSWQNVLLLISSYVFYGWWDYRFCGLMLASTLVDYFLASAIHRSENETRRKRLLLASLVCNLGLLGVFKYFHFFCENLVAIGETLGWDLNTGTLHIILPVGISFYTFQTLSYTIDVYYRRLKPTQNLIDYMTFVSFFPQLVAGPIERARNLLPQFQQQRFFHLRQMQLGVHRILWGLFKKVVIADTVAGFVNSAYSDVASASGAELVMATFLFAFQIYCDFSGYSDIAIGVAQMFGIKLMRNFAYPYFSQSLREFWSRWHISLSSWFRDYVYIPLGGNRASRGRQKLNLLITFLVSGFLARRRLAVRGLGRSARDGRGVRRSKLIIQTSPAGCGRRVAHPLSGNCTAYAENLRVCLHLLDLLPGKFPGRLHGHSWKDLRVDHDDRILSTTRSTLGAEAKSDRHLR